MRQITADGFIIIGSRRYTNYCKVDKTSAKKPSFI